MLTRRMMALLRQSKKSLRGFPSAPILLRMRPKATEKTSRPKTLIPFELLCTGTLSFVPGGGIVTM